MFHISSHYRGYALALLGVIVLSPDALLIRWAGDNPYITTAVRGLIGGLMVIIYNQLIDRRSIKRQWDGFNHKAGWVALTNAVSHFCFVYAIHFTNVTNVLVIIAFAPLASAFLSSVFIGEQVKLRTWIAAMVCGIGLAVLMAQPPAEGEVLGLMAAVVCALTLAGQFVIMRSAPSANLTAAIGFGNLISGSLCLAIVGMGAVFALSGTQWLALIVVSTIVSPVPFVLFAFSLRYISAAETSLIMLLESILGSLWVWWFLAEAPSQQTFFAGVVILSSLTIYSVFMILEQRRTVIK